MSIKSVFFSLLLLIAVNVNAQSVFVLVHGAWHGGWCWQKVSTKLRAAGNVVYTPTLSGLGEHKNTLNKDVDLNTHITDIVNLIEMEDLHNVVLVGHSYAGAVIAGVADRIPERLSKLIFLDALLMENGQSTISVQPKEMGERVAKSAEQDHGLSIPAWSPETFGVTNPEDIKWTKERLTAQPYRAFTQPLVLKHPYGNNIPMSYIACLKPQMPVLKVFADKAQNSKDWKYYTLNTGHDAMITMPDELTTLLESI
jgi:pimeloyl-ACP methyl ester carboxylesterase